jgi:hypothetical protein
MLLENMKDLERAFMYAKENNCEINLLIEVPDLPKPEMVTNPYENLDIKLDYYKKSYTDNLELKTFPKIRIIASV